MKKAPMLLKARVLFLSIPLFVGLMFIVLHELDPIYVMWMTLSILCALFTGLVLGTKLQSYLDHQREPSALLNKQLDQINQSIATNRQAISKVSQQNEVIKHHQTNGDAQLAVRNLSSMVSTNKEVLSAIEGIKNKEKGDAFERLIVRMLKHEDNELVHWRGDKICLNKDGDDSISPASSKWPDLEFRTCQTNEVYAVECKWRSSWMHGSKGSYVKIARDKQQLMNYCSYDSEFRTKPVKFLALGVGGTPDHPNFLCIISLDKGWMSRSDKYPHYLHDNEVNHPSVHKVSAGETLRFRRDKLMR